MTGKEGINLRLRMRRAMLCVKIYQSCPTLCNFIDYSLPKSSVQGVLQARILNGLPYLPPGYLPNPGAEPKSLTSPALAGELTTSNSFCEGKGPPIQYSLPGKSHGQRSLVGCRQWGCQESDTTERLHIHFSLSCTGEENGNQLQCYCLENPRDRAAWWAAISGVAQSRTRLKQLSSSSVTTWEAPGCKGVPKIQGGRTQCQ